MRITIDLEILDKYSLSPNMYIWLHCKIHSIDHPAIKLTDIEEKYLIFMNLIKIQGNDIILRPKLKEIFQLENVEDWVDDYRKIFIGSRNSKSMGDRSVVIQKLKRFLIENPKYNKSHIMSAAERYINTCRAEGVLNRQADFFIYKQEMVDGKMVRKSDLLSTLEDIEYQIERISQIENQQSNVEW